MRRHLRVRGTAFAAVVCDTTQARRGNLDLPQAERTPQTRSPAHRGAPANSFALTSRRRVKFSLLILMWRRVRLSLLILWWRSAKIDPLILRWRREATPSKDHAEVPERSEDLEPSRPQPANRERPSAPGQAVLVFS